MEIGYQIVGDCVSEVSESAKCVRSIKSRSGRSVRGNSYRERQDGNKRRAREALNCNTIKEGASDGLTSERSERWLDRQVGASSGKRRVAREE